jgi:anti-sigma B factor antagonist
MLSPATPLPLPGFSVARGSEGDYTVLELSGELDLASSADLDREVMAAILRTDAGALVLDLTALEFMDCSGLHVLLEAHRRCQRSGIELRLRGPRHAVRRVLDLTDTARLFDVVP